MDVEIKSFVCNGKHEHSYHMCNTYNNLQPGVVLPI